MNYYTYFKMFFQSTADNEIDNEAMYFDNPSNLALATLNNVDGLNSLHVGLFNIRIKDEVWNNYFGKDVEKGKCFLCKNYIDRNASSMHMFRCAYYISCQNGGSITPNNLKPVCQVCHEKLDGRSLSEVLPEVHEYVPKLTMNNSSSMNWLTNNTSQSELLSNMDTSMNVESNQHNHNQHNHNQHNHNQHNHKQYNQHHNKFQTVHNNPSFSFANNHSNAWNFNSFNENNQNYSVDEVMDVL